MSSLLSWLRPVLRWSLRIAALVLLVPVGAVLWYTPIGTDYVGPDDPRVAAAVSSLREHGRPPVDYVVSEFARRDVVIVGEPHRVAEDAAFVRELIAALPAHGVHTLLLEFGVQSDQQVADRLLSAATFDRQAAKKILADLRLLWLYEDYLGLFETAWRVNRALRPGRPRFEILLGTPAGGRVGGRAGKDATMARLVLERVQRGDKVLVYCGSHHGFTAYRQPLPFEPLLGLEHRGGRMGNRLRAELGDRVAFLRLHAPVAKRWALFAWPLYRRPLLLPFRGVIDHACDALGAPFAFSTDLEPLGSIEDRVSYYSLHRQPLRLRDLADGYIVLSALRDRHAVRPFRDLGDGDDLPYLRALHAGTPLLHLCRSKDVLVDAVATEGLLPARAWRDLDRTGYRAGAWLPPFRAFWLLAGALGPVFGVRRWRRRQRERTVIS